MFITTTNDGEDPVILTEKSLDKIKPHIGDSLTFVFEVPDGTKISMITSRGSRVPMGECDLEELGIEDETAEETEDDDNDDDE